MKKDKRRVTKRERGRKSDRGGERMENLRGEVRRLREKGKSKEGQSKEEGKEGEQRVRKE